MWRKDPGLSRETSRTRRRGRSWGTRWRPASRGGGDRDTRSERVANLRCIVERLVGALASATHTARRVSGLGAISRDRVQAGSAVDEYVGAVVEVEGAHVGDDGHAVSHEGETDCAPARWRQRYVHMSMCACVCVCVPTNRTPRRSYTKGPSTHVSDMAQ